MPVVVRRVDKKKAGNSGWWSDKERYQTVATYLILGKYGLTAAATGVPEETIRRWKAQEWWKEAADEISRSSKIELNGKITSVINKSLTLLEDRLEHGDYLYDPKTGEFVRKPVNASIINRITGDLITKSLILDKEIATERQTDEGLDERLKKLKEEMLRFARAKTIEGEVIHESISAPTGSVQQEEGSGRASNDGESGQGDRGVETDSQAGTGPQASSDPTTEDWSIRGHPEIAEVPGDEELG